MSTFFPSTFKLLYCRVQGDGETWQRAYATTICAGRTGPWSWRRCAGRTASSRTEIAAATGLSHSTISAISSDLIDEGILLPLKGAEVTSLKRGRPQVALGLNPDAARVVTIVLALNTLVLSLIDYAGGTLGENHCGFRPPRWAAGNWPRPWSLASRNCLLPMSFGRPLRVTMAIQGIVDAQGRELLWSPITPHTHLPFADMLEAKFDIPVTLENDCNMIAIALRERSPERYRDNLTAIMLSNGIGMGLILGGRLFTGPFPPAANSAT
jgi:hypothetical protein